MDTCAWQGCDRTDIYARGLCRRCNMRARRAGVIHEFPRRMMTCPHCGIEFESRSSGNLYCNAECQRLDRLDSDAAARLAMRQGRACITCSGHIPDTRRKDATACSIVCQQSAWYDRNAERLRTKARSWNRGNAEARAEYTARRRALVLGSRCEAIDLTVVWQRDDGCCWICGDAVDPNAGPKDLMRRSLDHVVPLTRSGTHTMDNVALTHLLCNVRKRARVLEHVPRWMQSS